MKTERVILIYVLNIPELYGEDRYFTSRIKANRALYKLAGDKGLELVAESKYKFVLEGGIDAYIKIVVAE